MFRPGDWSALPGDVWFSIGLKLDGAADRVRFRAVSKSLRSHLPYRQPPWLMLSEFHDDSDDSEVEDDGEGVPVPRRRFVILGGQRYFKFDLPQAHLARCLGSANNWVITIKTDIILRLLNPFTRVEIDLPDGLNFGDRFYDVKPPPPRDLLRGDHFLKKVIICPPSSCGGTDLLVIAIQNRHGKVAVARPGDSCWTTVKTEQKDHNRTQDVVVYQRRLYAINEWGLFLSSNIIDYPNSPIQLSVAAQEFDKFPIKIHPLGDVKVNHILYLVEWSGHLLLVIKFINILEKLCQGEVPMTFPFYKTVRFQIYMFDFSNRSWIEINSLGEYSLFLGFNNSVSVLASDYFGLVKKNCIYFTDDYSPGYILTQTPGGYDMGIFDLGDDSIKPHYKGKSTSYYSPPIWIVPD